MKIVPFGVKIRKKRKGDTIDLKCRRDTIVLDQRIYSYTSGSKMKGREESMRKFTKDFT